jgi:hypothetical protein
LSNKTHSNKANDSQAPSIKAKKFNPYSGGRSLNAIRYSKLTPTQRHILLEITSQMDFRGDFQSSIQVSKSRIAKYTGYSREAVVRNLISLENLGYVKQETKLGSSSQIGLTSKLFDEYRMASENISHVNSSKDSGSMVQTDNELPSQHANLGCDPKSQDQSDLRSKVTGGVIESHRGCDRESYLYSPSSPLIYSPLYLRRSSAYLPGKSAAEQIRLYDNFKFSILRQSQKGETMSIKNHPLTAILKEAGQKRKEEKAAKSLVTASIEKTLSVNTGKSQKDAEDLFSSFQSYFRGGSGRFCYKTQRAFWARVVENDLVEEAKTTLNFFHGVDKPTAQVSAGNKRMSDSEYANFLYDESLAIRTRKEKDKKEQEEIKREIEERRNMIENRTPEEIARRKEKMEKMRRMLKGIHR